MKRSIIRAVIAVAMAFVCVRINEAQSSDPSSQTTTSSAASIPSGQIFIMQLDTPLNTRFTKQGDKVELHTAADVVVDGQILIPNQSLVRGLVKTSNRAGLMGGRAELELSFMDVKLPDGTILPFRATITRAGFDPVYSRKGEDPKLKGEVGGGGTVKAGVSGAAQGALVGMIYRGPTGALYSGAAGAAISVVEAMLSGRRGPDLDLPPNTMFEARFQKPLEIPAQSVLAQNSPAAKSAARAETAALDTPVDEPLAKTRPVLKRPQQEQPIEEASISKQESNVGASHPDMPADESVEKSRPVLMQPQSTQTTEEASILKPEPSPDALPTAPREEATPAVPAGEGIKISVKVKMVQVDAVVRDRSGRVMAGLGLNDFKVYEDTVLQELVGFSQDKLPLAVAIVVDRSGSESPYIAELRWIASRALYNLKQQDEVCLFSFAQNVIRMQELTTDRQRIANAINQIYTGGGTNILDALYAAVTYLVSAAPDRRHAVILISDNEQTVRPMVSERELVAMAQEKDTVIYSLKTAGGPIPLGNQLPALFSGDPVGKIAQETGGELIKVADVGSLDSALNSVISRLRTSYSLSYNPSNSKSGVFHSITVRLADKFGKSGSDYSIQAKRGYYAVQSSKSIAGSQP
jgi:VWFA-related protein